MLKRFDNGKTISVYLLKDFYWGMKKAVRKVSPGGFFARQRII